MKPGVPFNLFLEKTVSLQNQFLKNLLYINLMSKSHYKHSCVETLNPFNRFLRNFLRNPDRRLKLIFKRRSI